MLDFSLSGFKYITLLPFEYHSVFSPNELITSVTTMGMIGFLKSKTAKLLFLLFVMLISANTSTSEASAAVFTHESETQVLRDLFRSLNRPQQLKNWKLESGDPCNESWTGVRCNESSITHLKLNGLGLNGTLCSQLSNLRNLKLLDISSNSIEGPIPNSLPLNVTHLIFAENKFSESFLYVIGELIHLRQLNLSHNALSGPLPNVFTALENLHEMDLSFNSFIGDLPPSFQSLTNVTRLFLESNQLTGSVHFLANMPLSDLNIMDNHFTGVIPDNFQFICNLTGGNSLNKEIKEAPSSSHFHTFASLKFSKFLFITSEKRAKLSYEPQYTRGQNVARLVFGILGNIFKLCLFLSEIVTVILFNNENGTGDCKPYPYLVMMCNSCIWIILVEHFPVKTWIILVINIVGLVLNFIYALIFWQYTRSGWYQNFLLYGGILAGIILCVYGIPILNAIPYTHRALVAGIVCVLCTIASYAYPTLVLCNSPDESGATFPMLSSVFGLLSGIAWTVYGLIGPNPYAFTAIGNATGCLVSLAEIYVHGDFTFGGNVLNLYCLF